MPWSTELGGFVAGLLIAVVTSPVGISGAVFLLPVQLDVLGIPSPRVTPTNLLFNVVAVPGSLLRYRRRTAAFGRLSRLLVAGTLPGVIAGAVIRVYLVPGVRPFRVIAGLVLLPLGAFVLTRRSGGAESDESSRSMTPTRITGMAAIVGVVAGIYGIGGGSLMGPVLVGSGFTVAAVAPAALASTFVTSIVGAVTYAALAVLESGAIAPDWAVGSACGLGGLVGGYVGAHLQPRLPERALRILLGVLAMTLGAAYLGQGLT
ncbi:MAG TPA: sulfite exporter TauE/SafE family protein [Acidimicrobiia bacterium]|nr:sulfite exporter TauE/SafE family protein [Acidimicrobiia bacterium]